VAVGDVVKGTRWLLPVVTDAEVSGERAAWVLAGLRDLPVPLADLFWRAGVRVVLRARFDSSWDPTPWHGPDGESMAWSESGGYWDVTDRDVVLNGAWPGSESDMRSCLYHELGHAHHDLVGRPQRGEAFRTAWKIGRRRVQKRHPRDYAARHALGMYCIHWTRGTMEAWADAFTWHLGGRAAIHPGFGRTFRECVEVVASRIDQLQEAA
jgi:hypothetical protein